METTIFDEDDDKFIGQAIKFCKAIDKYTKVLGLNADDVETLKGDVNVTVYVATRYPSFTPSFIQYNIDSLRNRLTDLSYACKSSKNYTRAIGLELGLETVGQKKHVFSETLHKLFDGTLYGHPHFQ
jgi:hypothetical protein